MKQLLYVPIIWTETDDMRCLRSRMESQSMTQRGKNTTVQKGYDGIGRRSRTARVLVMRLEESSHVPMIPILYHACQECEREEKGGVDGVNMAIRS